jgi:alcohol dehydrogenase class IV
VCKFNLKYKANVDRQAMVKDLLLGQAEVKQLLESRGLDGKDPDLGDILAAVISALEMPRSLEEVGIGQESLDTLARNSLEDIWIRTNAVPITEEAQVREILDMCAKKQ